MKTTVLVLFISIMGLFAEEPRLAGTPKSMPNPYTVDMDTSLLSKLYSERLAMIQKIYEDALKPSDEDYKAVTNPGDNYTKNWPELFGPEAKRRERFQRAQKMSKDLQEDVADMHKRSLEFERIRIESQLTAQRMQDAVRLETENNKINLDIKRAEANKKIVADLLESTKNQPEVEIRILPDGTILIEKGKKAPVQATPIQVIR